jgi:hypothetical protein
VKLAGDGRELRNCGSQILKVRNRSSATFLVRNSEIDLVVRNIAELRRCGLKLRMLTFGHHAATRRTARNFFSFHQQQYANKIYTLFL